LYMSLSTLYSMSGLADSRVFCVRICWSALHHQVIRTAQWSTRLLPHKRSCVPNEALVANGWSWGCVSAVDSKGQTIWIADAHRDPGKRFVVRADEKLAAFLELQSAIRTCGELALEAGARFSYSPEVE